MFLFLIFMVCLIFDIYTICFSFVITWNCLYISDMCHAYTVIFFILINTTISQMNNIVFRIMSYDWYYVIQDSNPILAVSVNV